MRARDLGVTIGTGTPGQLNAITDVPGVRVGLVTLVEGTDVRTGVTVIAPATLPLFAGCHRLNGNGEITGLEYLRENGALTTPVAITNTHSVGVVRDALTVALPPAERGDRWSLPVVGETWDGLLNDIDGHHVTGGHLHEALAGASAGPVPEGNVGGGTGMVSFGFKAGTGTASRVLERDEGGWTVGVLVQSNFGRRQRLRVDGAPVGERIPHETVPDAWRQDDSSAAASSSIIAVAATDAPLLPGQCDRLAQRIALGVGRLGGAGEDSSGDLFLCFATGNELRDAGEVLDLRAVRQERLDPLFYAVIEATEEAVVNALVGAETMTGYRGRTAHALPHELLVDAVRARAAPASG